MTFEQILKNLRSEGWRTQNKFPSPAGMVVILKRRSATLSVEKIVDAIYLNGKLFTKRLLNAYL